MTTETPGFAERMSRVLDPQWLKDYASAVDALAKSSAEFGTDGFKQLMELEKQRISLQADARVAEIRLQSKLELERIRVDNDLWLERFRKSHRWFGLDNSNAFFLLAIFAAIAVAVLK